MPYFSDSQKWTDAVIKQALCLGDAQTGGRGWGSFYLDDCGNLKKRGMFNYAGHFLVTTYSSTSGATDPTNQTTQSGKVIASQSVSDESTSYANYSASSLGDAVMSAYLSTTYGSMYLELRSQVVNIGVF